MADTIRTKAELLAIFDDARLRGVDGIDPQDIRDLVMSLGVGGTMYANDVPLDVTGAWAPVTAFTNSIDTSGITDDLVTGEFVIGAGADGVFGVSTSMGIFYPVGPDGWVEFAITKDGALTPYRAKVTLSAGGDEIAPIIGSGNLAEGDRIGLAVRASGVASLTLNNGQFRAIRG